MKKRLLHTLVIFLFALLVMTGCNNKEVLIPEQLVNQNEMTESENQQEDSQKEQPDAMESDSESYEPVTIKFYLHTTLEDFEMYIQNPVKEQFPHVTLERINRGEGSQLSNLIAANQVPDIVWEGLWYLGNTALPLDLPLDLTELAKKHQFDFNVFEPTLVNMIKSFSDQDEILFMPYNSFVFATQYNKDIFDLFGEEYLKDFMTWEEMTEIGRRMTQTVDGVDYRGIQHRESNRTAFQLGLTNVDSDTGKITFTTDDRWKKLLDVWKYAHDVQNQPKFTSFGRGWDDFASNKVLAIWPDLLMLQNYDMVQAEENGLNWDIVTYPFFEDNPNVGTAPSADGFYITKTSKHPDLAFEIISYLATNKEVQLEATKNGRITALNDSVIKQHAFENNPAAEGKNLEHIFDVKPADTPIGLYHHEGISIMNRIIIDYINDKADANTLLRQAEEELLQQIQVLEK